VLLLVEDQWTIWVTPHLVGDTLIIFMATSLEPALLSIVIVALIGTDLLAFMTVLNIAAPISSAISAVKMSIIAQISLAAFSFFMIFASKVSSLNKSETLQDSESVFKPTVLSKKLEVQPVRKRKSTSTLAF